jgi:hypothetical protein
MFLKGLASNPGVQCDLYCHGYSLYIPRYLPEISAYDEKIGAASSMCFILMAGLIYIGIIRLGNIWRFEVQIYLLGCTAV